MKTLRLYILFLLVSLSTVVFAVTLPPYSFFGANELYEENEDNVEVAGGATIGGINLRLATDNNSWGESCFATYPEQGECQDCCSASWETDGYSDAGEILYENCMKTCGGGPSLPLGSVLWLLPYALAYAVYKKIKF